MPDPPLEPLPYEQWVTTKTTLQLYAQIVGKLQLRYTAHRNHWWNVTFVPSARGMRSHLMRSAQTLFDIEFDFVAHRVVLRSNRAHESEAIALRDGLSVADFYRALFSALRDMGLSPQIVAEPYGMDVRTPFARDTEHHAYDAVLAHRWWNAVVWSAGVLEEFDSAFAGKQSAPQLFWHSFDLAVGRFSGRESHKPLPEDPVAREAYTHEVIALGFWAGDARVPQPAFYTYTAPEPENLTTFALRPQGAKWIASGSGHLGILPYDAVRESANSRSVLLEFFASGYEAGTAAAKWDTSELACRYVTEMPAS